MNVVLTESAAICLEQIEAFKARTLGCPGRAADFTDTLLDGVAGALENNPERFRVCPELAEFGLPYQERIEGDHRTIFEVRGETVYILAVLHCRQSIQEALYKLMILR